MSEQRRRLSRAVQLRVKHALDRVLAAVLLVLLAPLFAIVAAAIKLDDGGPVLFRQPRIGRAGQPFTVVKFRSMVVDADRLLDAAGVPVAPRLSRAGRWLRRLSLDELPQLVNVLRGEMSIVGPRPLLPMRLPQLDDTQRRRFEVRPGLTGLAQVRGRNDLPWSQRLACDVEYVDRFSLWLDARIIGSTLPVVVRGEGIAADRNPGEVDDLPAIAANAEERGDDA